MAHLSEGSICMRRRSDRRLLWRTTRVLQLALAADRILHRGLFFFLDKSYLGYLGTSVRTRRIFFRFFLLLPRTLTFRRPKFLAPALQPLVGACATSSSAGELERCSRQERGSAHSPSRLIRTSPAPTCSRRAGLHLLSSNRMLRLISPFNLHSWTSTRMERRRRNRPPGDCARWWAPQVTFLH